MALTILVAYDITQDSRRARLAALLQAWGDRIQYSLFLCTIGDDQVEPLTEEIANVIDVETDSVFVIRQCKSCWDSLRNLGQGEPPRQELCWEAF